MTLPAINNIIDWIKKNKQLAILAGGILVILILVIIALWPKSSGTGVALIEQPLFFYEDKTITINSDVYKDWKNTNKKYDIYKIKTDNLNIKVEGILSQLNINTPTKTGFDNLFYAWNNKSGDSVQYNVKTQSVEIKLVNHLNIFTDIASPSDDQLKALLPSFVHKYINGSYEYTGVTVEKKSGETIVSGRRLLNGIPIQISGSVSNYDQVILDDRYNLKGATILLVSFEDIISDKLKVIKPKELANVISKNEYPKEIATLLPNGLKINVNLEDESHGDNLEQRDIPIPSSFNAKNIELVYLFSNTDQQFLTPVYRLAIEGQITYKGSTYNVDGVVNASAIDPDHVYIPSNITYAQ